MIKEIIVVEGRADASAVKGAVEAELIILSGYGISVETFKRLDRAYETRGLILFTDPDHAGERIRERLTKRYPNAKQARLTRKQANKAGNIGIENAKKEDITQALENVKFEQTGQKDPIYNMEDMRLLGLFGKADSAGLREQIGEILGIGYGNAKTFLNRLNHYGIKEAELIKAFEQVGMTIDEQ